jgi:hypothetical protein
MQQEEAFCQFDRLLAKQKQTEKKAAASKIREGSIDSKILFAESQQFI